MTAQDELLERAAKTKLPAKALDKYAKAFEAEKAKEEVGLLSIFILPPKHECRKEGADGPFRRLRTRPSSGSASERHWNSSFRSYRARRLRPSRRLLTCAS